MQGIDFDEIPINREEISQSKLNIENKTRSNLFNWNGQFSLSLLRRSKVHIK